MDDEHLSRFLEDTDREVLQDAGKVTAEIAWAHALSEFEKYRVTPDRAFVSDFDRFFSLPGTPARSKPPH